LEAAGAVLRIVMAVLTVLVVAVVAAGLVLPRPWGARVRAYGNAAVGALAAVLVFDVQSGSVGASIGGAVLALAAGAVAMLIVMLFRNV
jgi:hypothetical protein